MKDNHPDFQDMIEPELEARIVAWVLGEASAFEADELERIAGERPEVMAFKQEIEAVHGLAGAAMGPSVPLRLSPMRRAKLLQKFGLSPDRDFGKVEVLPGKRQRKEVPWRVRIVEFAAVLLILSVLAGIALPVFSSVQVRGTHSRAMQRKMTFSAGAVNTESLATDGSNREDLPMEQPQGAAQMEAKAGRNALADISKSLANTTSASGAVASVDREVVEPEPAGISPQSSIDRMELAWNRPAREFKNEDAPADGAKAVQNRFAEVDKDFRDENVINGAIVPSTAPVAAAAKEKAPVDESRLLADANRGASFGMAPAPASQQSQDYATSEKPEESAKFQLSLDGANTYTGGTTVSAGNRSAGGGVGSGRPVSGGAVSAKPVEKVKQLITEADGLYNTGKFDLASKRYEQALNVDPYNASARKGEEKVNSAKANYAMAGRPSASMPYQMEKAWDRPVRNFGQLDRLAVVNGQTDSRGTQRLSEKLNRITIPKVEFKNATVREAIAFFNSKSKDLDVTEPDPSRRGVNIVLKMGGPSADVTAGAPDANARNLGDATINLSLSNVPLVEALNYVTKLANLKYKLDPYAVFVVPQSEATEVLATKEFTVPTGYITEQGRDPKIAKEILAKAGVQFPPGAYTRYFPESRRIIMRNTQENLDLVDKIVQAAVKKAPTKQESLAEITQSESAVKDQPFSTFSLHVSDVSFRLAQAALAKGQMPDPETIRPEEFYNALDYGDPAPGVGEKVGCRIEQCAHPFLQQRNLVRIAMRVPASGRGKGQPLRLTVLLDTSGSMEREDRSSSVRRAMEVLASLLGPDDRVTLIGFARQPRLLLDQIPGDQAARLVEAVTHTPSEGGTNLEEALRLAGEKALNQRSRAAQNRIVLLTDGAVNLGDAHPESLAHMVEKLRQQGVSFDACGVGADGYNDEVLEALTRKGDGRYYFLNRPEDADAGFARQLAGAFRPAAQNVKVQVCFNPARVAHYRLIGFEQHRLKKEDFRNDKVDAAELAAEEAAVALYQVEVLPEGEGELGEVSVRFRDAASTEMVERCWTAPFDAQARAFDRASPSMQLAGTAAMMAEKLRGGAQANLIDLDTLTPVVNGLRANYASQHNVQTLVTMFGQMQRMK